MTNIAVIPARGGSRRVPQKNRRLFFGKPIIVYSIDTAKASRVFDHIYVSTDDEQIAEVAAEAGANVVMRPLELCQDEIGTQEVVAHVLNQQLSRLSRSLHPDKPDYACCIYATAPLMRPEDLREGYDAVRLPHTHWAFAVGYPPLQDAGQWYWGNLWAWAFQPPLVGPRTRLVHIPPERVCDINTEEDWQLAENLWRVLARMDIATKPDARSEGNALGQTQ